MRVGSRFVLVVEPHCAIWTEIVGVACLRPITASNSVHSASSDHVAFSVEDEIDLLGSLVVVRKIG